MCISKPLPGIGDEETWGAITGPNDPRYVDDDYPDEWYEDAEKQLFNARIGSDGWVADSIEMHKAVRESEQYDKLAALIIECVPNDELAAVDRDAKYAEVGRLFAEMVRQYAWPDIDKEGDDREIKAILDNRAEAESQP